MSEAEVSVYLIYHLDDVWLCSDFPSATPRADPSRHPQELHSLPWSPCLRKSEVPGGSRLVAPFTPAEISALESPQQGRPDMLVHSLEQLGDEIAVLSAHLDAATVRLLDLIREFDIREGWNTGFRSCAAWLAWRVGLDMGAARERVRVARALEGLPRLKAAL